DKVLFPTFFKNVYQYNLSVSVYLQVLPYLFFGKSLLATRAVSVLVSLLVPLTVGLALRDVFKSPYWWSGALVASLAPAWFLHSRTAFETVMAVSFYSAFLYLYLLYRCRSPRYLYGALAMAALAFYTYSPAQVYVTVTCLLLLLIDARYHWEHRQVAGRAALLGLLLAVPYLRFRFNHPEATTQHLAQLNSYWLEDVPLLDKVRRFAGEYLNGLSPGYWFIPNEKDLGRHVMKGYGHLLRPMLPFMVVGLILVLRRLRQPSYRILLVALLAAPAGAAIVGVGITRILVFIVPAAIVITLGISQVLLWLERIRLPRTALAAALFTVLSLANVWMLRDSLVKGPTWYTDYGLHGMQFGARQVFGAIQDYLEDHPGGQVFLASSWANGADLLARFFLPDPLPIEMAGIEGFLPEVRALREDPLFVLPAYEYAQAIESGKFTDFRVERVIPYPDGEPGFYMAHFRYRDDIEEVLAEERALRRALLEATLVVDGDQFQVRHTTLDTGEIAGIFDGDPLSVARTGGVNPFVIELVFEHPREINGYDIIIGSAYGELHTIVYPDDGQPPIEHIQPFRGSIEQPLASVELDEPVIARRIRVEVHDQTQGESGFVHVWELALH
ncbi:MAG TPA: glycosyltransferase family 39 protein, partial [Anaerolineales bacterium]|nr:glycosyltransferase family 39 protein [Anaerolineales bacterium]